jgi:aerobic-type carbon monoxide dehydrogenase small subunit (CoxS/CutS family)
MRDELNDFLREYLGMTGTKFGCGAAQYRGFSANSQA